MQISDYFFGKHLWFEEKHIIVLLVMLDLIISHVLIHIVLGKILIIY